MCVCMLQGDVYGYKHALAISQYEVEDAPMRDRERVSFSVTDSVPSLPSLQCVTIFGFSQKKEICDLTALWILSLVVFTCGFPFLEFIFLLFD